MADEAERTARDIDAARRAADEIAAGLSPEAARGRFTAADLRAGADALLDSLAAAARRHEDAPGAFLSDERRARFAADMQAALRLFRFAAAMELPGVAVLRGPRNAFDALPLFDAFSRRARESVAPTPGPPVAAEDEARWPALRPWLMQAAQRGNEVGFMPPEAAARGFLALAFDTLRATARAFRSGAATTQVFTLDSQNHGYLVDCYPQYRYAPVAFGTKPSRPVSAPLATGHYHFQGWLNNAVTKEPRVYFAGPGSTSGTTQAF